VGNNRAERHQSEGHLNPTLLLPFLPILSLAGEPFAPMHRVFLPSPDRSFSTTLREFRTTRGWNSYRAASPSSRHYLHASVDTQRSDGKCKERERKRERERERERGGRERAIFIFLNESNEKES